MAYILYRDHTIVSSADYDDVTGNWKLTACVSWQSNGDQIQFLKNSPAIFSCPDDAEKAGIEYSKKWVDKKLAVYKLLVSDG